LYKEYLSDETEIKDTIKEIQSNVNNLTDFLNENAERVDFTNIEDKELVYYLQKRHIYTDVLKLYNHENIEVYRGIKDKIEGRIIFKGYIGTNFEGRLYKEYLVAPKTYKYRSSIHDFFLIDNENKNKTLFMLIPQYSFVSLGGWRMYHRLFFFLKLLRVIYGKDYRNIIFVFDRDIPKETIDIISNNIGSIYMSDYANIKITRFGFSLYKDVGEVPENEFGQLTDYILDLAYT